ncbi:hypothetical protein ABZ070_04855 [Streptomyces sp. NPDC006283]|uniref:hypothetical protein n=1 Tax=Streptomyces sp. NPDC006283 TaxID=3156741 RepID=UPI0033B9D96F
MRPVLKALLRKGVPARVLDAALAGMRMWYRLSRVAAQGSRRFTIRAWASPPKVVVPGTKVEIEPREALRFVEQLAKKVRDESRARKTDGVSVATDAETGKVTHVRAGEGTRFSDVVAHLDEIQAQNRFPEHGAKKGKKEDGEEYDLPGEWELGWAGEAGGVNMHEQPGSVNTLAHMRKEGQKRGSPPPYQKLAKEKGVHGYKYLFKHGADYLRLFQGKIVGNMSKLNRLKARTLMALTGYNEKRRDETARVYSAMLAKMLERASTQNDYKLIPAAIAEYPMAAQGAQGAAPSKEAWVSGKSEQKQLEELDKKYEGLLKSASTDDERKALHAKKSREKRGITGADVNVAERRNKNGKVTRPAGVKHMVSGEELAAREIQYINMFLSGYTFDYADDVDPQKVKEDVFRKIEREVLDAHGLN